LQDKNRLQRAMATGVW